MKTRILLFGDMETFEEFTGDRGLGAPMVLELSSEQLDHLNADGSVSAYELEDTGTFVQVPAFRVVGKGNQG